MTLQAAETWNHRPAEAGALAVKGPQLPRGPGVAGPQPAPVLLQAEPHKGLGSPTPRHIPLVPVGPELGGVPQAQLLSCLPKPLP